MAIPAEKPGPSATASNRPAETRPEILPCKLRVISVQRPATGPFGVDVRPELEIVAVARAAKVLPKVGAGGRHRVRRLAAEALGGAVRQGYRAAA
jgi:hypothetical protein